MGEVTLIFPVRTSASLSATMVNSRSAVVVHMTHLDARMDIDAC
jgi:hypothetical protein